MFAHSRSYLTLYIEVLEEDGLSVPEPQQYELIEV